MGSEEFFLEEEEQKSIIEEQKWMDLLEIVGSEGPIGAKGISERLRTLGYDLSESTVRYHLRILEERGFLRRVKFDGRVLTEKGRYELSHALVEKRLGSALSEIEERMHQTTFDPEAGEGKIVVSKVRLKKEDLDSALRLMEKASTHGVLLSHRYGMREKGEEVEISFVSAITFDGVLLKSGILCYPRYSGFLELNKGQPLRFTSLFGYENTSFNYLDFLFGQKIVQTTSFLETGTGHLYATYREIPLIALDDAVRVLERLREQGIYGLTKISRPGKATLLGIPVTRSRAGIAITGSLSLVIAFHERGIAPIRVEAWAIEDLSTLNRSF
jgi:hypothetical protein